MGIMSRLLICNSFFSKNICQDTSNVQWDENIICLLLVVVCIDVDVNNIPYFTNIWFSVFCSLFLFRKGAVKADDGCGKKISFKKYFVAENPVKLCEDYILGHVKIKMPVTQYHSLDLSKNTNQKKPLFILLCPQLNGNYCGR